MKMRWTRSLPASAGDYLWMNVLSCGCCVSESGICWVVEDDWAPRNHGGYVYKKGKKTLVLIWGGKFPKSLIGKVLFNIAFLKLDMPNPDWWKDHWTIEGIVSNEKPKAETDLAKQLKALDKFEKKSRKRAKTHPIVVK